MQGYNSNAVFNYCTLKFLQNKFIEHKFFATI